MTVCANATQLQQTIMNLVNNASDALSGITHPQIRVGLKKVHADDLPMFKLKYSDSSYVEICVADKGCGIEPENLMKIMEPFFTTKGEGKGTGLGLAMVYGIVKDHLGSVYIKSQPGSGTSVYVYLPISAGLCCVKNPEEAVFEGNGETILLLDDQQDVREGGRETLRSLGYNVLNASDEVEAFELYSENRDLMSAVLSDVMMPRMQGVELASLIKQDNPKLPVILVSGYDKDDVLDGGMYSLVDQVLAKPFSVETMSAVLHRHLNNRG